MSAAEIELLAKVIFIGAVVVTLVVLSIFYAYGKANQGTRYDEKPLGRK